MRLHGAGELGDPDQMRRRCVVRNLIGRPTRATNEKWAGIRPIVRRLEVREVLIGCAAGPPSNSKGTRHALGLPRRASAEVCRVPNLQACCDLAQPFSTCGEESAEQAVGFVFLERGLPGFRGGAQPNRIVRLKPDLLQKCVGLRPDFEWPRGSRHASLASGMSVW